MALKQAWTRASRAFVVAAVACLLVGAAATEELETSLGEQDRGQAGQAGQAAIHPMISPSRRHRRPQSSHGGTESSGLRDSYLDALEYSRAEDAGPEGTRTRPRNPEAESKISRISHGADVIGAPDEYYHHHHHRVKPDGPSYDYGGYYGSYSYAGSPENEYGVAPPSPPVYSSAAQYGPPPFAVSSSSGSSGSSGSTGGHCSTSSSSGTLQQGESKGLGSLQATYSTSYPLPDIFPLALLPPVDFSWPISIKIDAYTLLKIVIKVIVFKMIVKFIAAICILIFLPKIVHKKDENNFEDKTRRSNIGTGHPSFNHTNPLTSKVTEAIKYYDRMNNKTIKKQDCTSSFTANGECRTRKRRRR